MCRSVEKISVDIRAAGILCSLTAGYILAPVPVLGCERDTLTGLRCRRLACARATPEQGCGHYRPRLWLDAIG